MQIILKNKPKEEVIKQLGKPDAESHRNKRDYFHYKQIIKNKGKIENLYIAFESNKVFAWGMEKK